jgi:programmed cell death 8 (apoptosis-inducing factor)
MIITNEFELPYMRPPLSKEIWYNKDEDDSDPPKFRQWNGNERSLYFEPVDFFIDPTKLMENENGGVAVVQGYSVCKIDPVEKKAILSDGTEIKYGKCLIATGARPKSLAIFESAPLAVKDRVTMFRGIQDYDRLKEALASKSKVAIVGGGFLGTEIACSLTKYAEVNQKPLEIFQIFIEDANLGNVLPQYLSNWTMNRVREEGVTVIPKSQVQSVEMHDERVKLSLADNTSILVDHVVLAVGSEANTDLSNASDLEVHPIHGGFVVNAELMARSNLYVVSS